MKLIDKNEKTYNLIKCLFTKYDRVGLTQCTGSGKSYIGAKWVIDNPNDNFLIISNNGVTLETYFRELRNLNNYKVLYYSKLYNMSVQDLTDYIKENKITKCVIEEFHHTGAECWQKGIENLLYLGKKYGMLFLGLSATPVRFLDSSRNMFAELEFKEVEGFTYKEMFDKGYCGGVVYHSLTYIDSDDNYYSDKLRRSALSEEVKNKFLSKLSMHCSQNNERNVPNYIKKVFKTDLNRSVCKFIAFFSTIEEAKSKDTFLHKLFQEYPNVHIHAITCDMADEEILRIVEEFDNATDGIHILTSVNLLTEGIHTDKISGVFFFRKTVSPNVFLQQFGRCISLMNLEKVHVFDFVSNLEEMQNYRNTVFDFISKSSVPYNIVKKETELFDFTGITVNIIELPIEELLKKIEETCKSVGVLDEVEMKLIDSFYKDLGEGVVDLIPSKPKQVVLNYINAKFKCAEELCEITEVDRILIKRCPYEGVSFIKNDARLTLSEKKNRINRANYLGVNKDINLNRHQAALLRSCVEKYGYIDAYKGMRKMHPVVVLNQLLKLGYKEIPKKLFLSKNKGWWKNEQVDDIYRI